MWVVEPVSGPPGGPGLRAAFLREDLSSEFSMRRLIDWAELMLRTGDPERAAEPAIYAKVAPEDAAFIRAIVRHHIAPGS